MAIISRIILSTMLCMMLISCSPAQPKLYPLVPGSVILAFGDSLTYGTGASAETSYPHDLEKLTGFKVINAGVPGEETQGGLARINDELNKSHPQLVILFLGANDLMHRRPESQIKENLRQIIQLIQKSGIQVMMVAVPAFTIYLSVPEFYSELGKEMNVPVETVIVAELERKSELKSDMVHFNQAGYQLLAQAIANFLKAQGAIAP